MISKKHQNFEEKKKKKSSALNGFGLVSKARQCDSALLFWQEIGVCEGAACPSLLAQCVVHAAPDAAAAAVLAEPSSRNQPVRLGQALALCPCPVPPLMHGQLQAHEHLAFLCCLFRLRVDKSKASSGSGWCCCSATRVPPRAGDLCPSGAGSCTSLSWLPWVVSTGRLGFSSLASRGREARWGLCSGSCWGSCPSWPVLPGCVCAQPCLWG